MIFLVCHQGVCGVMMSCLYFRVWNHVFLSYPSLHSTYLKNILLQLANLVIIMTIRKVLTLKSLIKINNATTIPEFVTLSQKKLISSSKLNIFLSSHLPHSTSIHPSSLIYLDISQCDSFSPSSFLPSIPRTLSHQVSLPLMSEFQSQSLLLIANSIELTTHS